MTAPKGEVVRRIYVAAGRRDSAAVLAPRPVVELDNTRIDAHRRGRGDPLVLAAEHGEQHADLARSLELLSDDVV